MVAASGRHLYCNVEAIQFIGRPSNFLESGSSSQHMLLLLFFVLIIPQVAEIP